MTTDQRSGVTVLFTFCFI